MLPGIVGLPKRQLWHSWNVATGATVTMNPSDANSNIVFSNGNLTVRGNGTANHMLVRATQGLPQGERGYFEVTFSGLTNSGGSVFAYWGLQDASWATTTGNAMCGGGLAGVAWGYDLGGTGTIQAGTFGLGSVVATGLPLVNATIGLAYDANTGIVYFRNSSGVFTNGNPTIGTAGNARNTAPNTKVFPGISFFQSSAILATFNFGGSAFSFGLP